MQKVLQLRSEPLTVSEHEALRVFGLTEESRPLTYIENNFEDKGEVIVDYATGLMWQQSGSKAALAYNRAQEYIEELNRQKFAGYDGWRLPTIPELMSLLEPQKRSNNLYINPMFDDRQRLCWSADKCLSIKGLSESSWLVSFGLGLVPRDRRLDFSYVRGIRF